MQDLYLHAITVFMGFFAMVNPLGNVPVFLGMVQDFDKKTQNRVALRASVTAFLIIAIFSIFGHIIFRIFGITVPAFQVAGGILVFLIGFQMMNSRENPVQSQSGEEKEHLMEKASDLAISPLGIPILAGPGTISTAMNFVGAQKSVTNVFLVVVIFAFMCVITYLSFLSAGSILSRFNPGLLKVVSRIMGLILTVIAVQMVINGVTGAIALYHQ